MQSLYFWFSEKGKGEREVIFFSNKKTEALNDTADPMLSGDQEMYCCFFATQDFFTPGI